MAELPRALHPIGENIRDVTAMGPVRRSLGGGHRITGKAAKAAMIPAQQFGRHQLIVQHLGDPFRICSRPAYHGTLLTFPASPMVPRTLSEENTWPRGARN